MVHIHIQYLSPLPQGAFSLSITDIKLGKKHSVIQVELRPSKAPSAGLSIIAIVTLGNLSVKGHGIPAPAVQLPDREKDCIRWVDAMFFNLSPTSSKVRSYVPKGGLNPLWSPAVGQNKRDMWVKPDDDNDSFEFAHLGFIADLVRGCPDAPSWPSPE